MILMQPECHPTDYIFWCEGCGFCHRFTTPKWTWNGSFDKPTVRASILNTREYGDNRQKQVCHIFITDGNIQYLSDCTHELVGKTVPMKHIPGSET